jgi:hypothetical protein
MGKSKYLSLLIRVVQECSPFSTAAGSTYLLKSGSKQKDWFSTSYYFFQPCGGHHRNCYSDGLLSPEFAARCARLIAAWFSPNVVTRDPFGE